MFLTMDCYSVSWLFVILSTKYTVTSQKIYESCIISTSANRSAKFDCNKNGIIVSASVESGTGSCLTPDGSRCYGLTPPLLVSKLNCYWKRNCTIHWPEEPIILTENGDQCIGEKPEFLELKYRCFRPDLTITEKTPDKEGVNGKIMLDMCSHIREKTDERILHQFALTGKSNLAGLIRSHAIYPWDYSDTARACIIDLYWPANLLLVVSVQDMELGEGDTLQIGNYTIDGDAISNKRLEFRSSGSNLNTIMNFTVGPYSNGGKGFVICFKFTDVNDQHDHSACDDITSGGDIQHFSDEITTSNPVLAQIEQTVTTTVAPITFNKKCEKKNTEKKKKKCYDRLNRKGGKNKKNKKGRGKRDKKSRKNRKE